MSPRAIAPFRRGSVYWARVPRLEAGAIQRSLGTTDKQVANQMCRFLETMRGQREAWLLGEMASGRCAVGPAYDAFRANRLDAFIVDLKQGLSDPDLEPHVEQWQAELVRRGTPNGVGRTKYLMQVRSLIHAGKPFPRSQFTRQRIRAWLESLKIAQTNRYRAAVSSFASYLVDEEILSSNPVLSVPMAKESAPRMVYLNQGEAKRLVGHMDGLYKRFHAFLLATGMEYGAAVKVFYPSDFTNRSVLAQGTKTVHRARTCRVTDTWLWAWEIATDGIHQGNPFRSVNYYAMRVALKAATEKAKLRADYTTHDHRHTWAVQALRDGLPLHVVAHQLGHRDPVMTLRVYGRFIPGDRDFSVNTSSSATVEAGDEWKAE